MKEGMPVGEVIAERYELLELIGKGGQAVVYRGRDRRSGDAVAVKVLPARAGSEIHSVERMAREQQAMVKLAGTSAVGYIDLCRSSSGAFCLVMELLKGTDLETRLQTLEDAGQKMPVSELLEVMRPIRDTLEKAHAVGIVHRDLKPANIFLAEPDGRARLLDFGLARMNSSNQLTELGQVLGSPSYIAPEMWKGRSSEADHRVDVYSFGVILFRMLAGRVPFEGADLKQKFLLATTAQRPSLHALRPELPVAVDPWVQSAMAIEPSVRYQSVYALFDALLQALGQPRTEADQPPKTSRKILNMRQWLATPMSSLPNTLTTAWSAAAGVLGKWRRKRGNASEQAATPPLPQPAPFVPEAAPSKTLRPDLELARKRALENQQTALASAAPPERQARPKPPPVKRPTKAVTMIDLSDFAEDAADTLMQLSSPVTPQSGPADAESEERAQAGKKKSQKKKRAKKAKRASKKKAQGQTEPQASNKKRSKKKQSKKKKRASRKKRASKKSTRKPRPS